MEKKKLIKSHILDHFSWQLNKGYIDFFFLVFLINYCWNLFIYMNYLFTMEEEYRHYKLVICSKMLCEYPQNKWFPNCLMWVIALKRCNPLRYMWKELIVLLVGWLNMCIIWLVYCKGSVGVSLHKIVDLLDGSVILQIKCRCTSICV